MLADENTIIGDLIDENEACIAILAACGMHCAGCPASRGETIGEACQVHGVNPAELIGLINKELARGQ